MGLASPNADLRQRRVRLFAVSSTASKQLEGEENGARERSARMETPRCLRHGTTRAQNSQKEERMSSARTHAKFPVKWLMSEKDEREALVKSEGLCKRGAAKVVSSAHAGEERCFLMGSKGRICV